MQNQVNRKLFPKSYTVIAENYISETCSTVYELIHNRTKAKIVWMSNDDDNKVFSIAFKTLPSDDTGVAHILEHSVLCGSKNYPCKEPFIEMVKGSFHTFLNAMTYPDKTVYPVASTNEKDFRNLMSVYLDAVFYPNIYTNDKILMQEGWHHHLEGKEQPLTYKGVVYNEMKGVFTSPESVLLRGINHELFPDTIYRHESGGDPDKIPNLTKRKFIGFHRKFYHPSNSRIFFYGEMDIFSQLEFLHKNYLSRFSYKAVDIEIVSQSPFDKQRLVEKKYPVSMSSSTRNKTYHSLSFVTGDVKDIESCIAFELLEEILINSSSSKLRMALLDRNICKDMFAHYETDMKQNFFTIVAKDCSYSSRERFVETVYEVLNEIVRDGLDKELVQGEFNKKWFHFKEGDYHGMPKGIVYNLTMLNLWLYDYDKFSYLRYDSLMQTLSKKIGEGYLEELIKEKLISNQHSLIMTLKPERGLSEKREKREAVKLEKIKNKLSPDNLDRLKETTGLLVEYQKSPDTHEQLNSIPKLGLSDIKADPRVVDYYEADNGRTKSIVIPQHTNGIVYFAVYFDLSAVKPSEMAHISLLTELLGDVSTKNLKYEDLNNQVNIHLGDLDFSCENFLNVKTGKYTPRLAVKSKFLREKKDEYIKLFREILTGSLFSDKKRIREVIQEIRSVVEQSILGKGNSFASMRIAKYISEHYYLDDLQHGIDFYRFICKLESSFDSEFSELKSVLTRLYSSVLNIQDTYFAYSSDLADLDMCENIRKSIESFLPDNNPEKNDYSKKLLIEPVNEGFIIPSRINFVGQGFNFKNLGYEYSGKMLALQKIINYDYLWNRVRVQGGSYGCNMRTWKSGSVIFTSYRDPEVGKTIDAYRDISDYLNNFKIPDEDTVKYIISATASLDTPQTPIMKLNTAIIRVFTGTTFDDVRSERGQLLAVKSDDIKMYSHMLKGLRDRGVICSIGGDKIKGSSRDLFDTVEDLI